MCNRSQRARQTLAWWATSNRPDEILARHREQHRPSVFHQLRHCPQHFHCLCWCLCKVWARIHNHLRSLNASRSQHCKLVIHERQHICHHVFIQVRISEAHLWPPTVVHEYVASSTCCNHICKFGVQQTTDVVNNVSTCIQRRRSHCRPIRINAHDCRCIRRHPLNHRRNAIDLFLFGNLWHTRNCRLPTNIQHISTLGQHFTCPLHPCFQRCILPSIRKRIRSGIDNSHNHRPIHINCYSTCNQFRHARHAIEWSALTMRLKNCGLSSLASPRETSTSRATSLAHGLHVIRLSQEQS